MASDFIDGLITAMHLIITLDPEVIEITIRSLHVSLVALFFAALIGIPTGIFLSSKSFRGKKIILVTVHAFMGFPPVLAGLILYLILTTNGVLGFLDLLFTEEAMMMVQFILAVPIIIGLTHNAVTEVPPEITELALTLGADRLKLWKTILNEAKSGITLGMITALGRLLAEVGGILIVGGNIRFKTRTLTTSIVQEVQKGDFSLALALGIILLTLSLLVNGGLTWFQFLQYQQFSPDNASIKKKNRRLNVAFNLTLSKGMKEEIYSFIEEYKNVELQGLIQEYLRLKEITRKKKKQQHAILSVMFKDIQKRFGQKNVFSGISSLERLKQGNLYGIIGPNGIGKSTLLKILSGILPAEMGQISLELSDNDKNIIITFDSNMTSRTSLKNTFKDNDILLSRTVYLHQHPVLLKGSCWDNVTYVQGTDSKESRRLGALLLTLVGLEDKVFHEASSLSGGQKQLLCFARALTTFPDILLLDEPTSNLDFRHMLKLEHVIYRLTKSNNMLILFSSHDLFQVQRISDKVGILKEDTLDWYDVSRIHEADDPWIIRMKTRISEAT